MDFSSPCMKETTRARISVAPAGKKETPAEFSEATAGKKSPLRRFEDVCKSAVDYRQLPQFTKRRRRTLIARPMAVNAAIMEDPP